MVVVAVVIVYGEGSGDRWRRYWCCRVDSGGVWWLWYWVEAVVYGDCSLFWGDGDVLLEVLVGWGFCYVWWLFLIGGRGGRDIGE